MNTLELKEGIIELISKIKNRDVLQHLYEIISEVLEDTIEDLEELIPEQKKSIDADIIASKDAGNLVDHELAIKKMSKWLKR